MALFEGTAGADVLVGGDGDDVLRGLGGDDFLDGGPGSDVVEFGRGDGRDTVNLSSPSPAGERDRLQLGAGITLSDLEFTADGGALVVGIKGSSDSVRLLGYVSAGDNGRTDIVLADGTVLDPQAVGRSINAYGHLSLWGTQGADALIGGVGNDTLVGLEGNDVLYGGVGNDLLDGGAGGDTYHFARGDGRDTVIDGPALPGERNRLQLGSGISLSDVSFSVENGDLVVGLKGSTDSVRITGYFGPGPNERTDIVFADGTVLGGLAVDQVVNASPGGASVYGTPGADVLVGGVGNDTVVGHLGNDVLYGGAGNDLLDGGVGSDTYHFNRGDGQDTVIDGPGQPGERSRLQLGAGILLSDVSFTLQDGDLVVSLKGSTDSIRLINYGGPGLQDRTQIVFADGALLDGLAVDRALGASPSGSSFAGTPGDDALVGGVGHDMLYGAEGNDALYGGAGNDQLDGGPGRDTYHFNRGDGQDTVQSGWSGPGERDRLQLGAGILLSDLTFTRDGSHLIVGIKGTSDSVRLNGYVHTTIADRPDVVLADGTVLGGEAVDRVLNANGDLSWGGQQGADVLIGGVGNDTLYGAEGNDTLYGSSGNDLLDGGAGSDTFHFARGDGRDTVIDGPALPGERNRLQLGSGISLSDVSFTVENGDLVVGLKGSTDSVRIAGYFGPGPNERTDIVFADGTVLDGLAVDRVVNAYPAGSSLSGTPGADVLVGGVGNDTVVGHFGNDVLYGGAGNDLLDGGVGSDTYHFNRGDGQDTVIDGPGQPGERSRLQLGAGILLSDVTLTLDNGDLVVSLKGSTDSIRLINYGGPGLQDRTQIVFADGTLLDGLAVDRVLQASPSGGSFNGTPGADVLVGGVGHDMLGGGAGDDTLYGGAGNDVLHGDEGRDTYHFNRGDGQDTVDDFATQPGERNRVQLGSGILLSDLTFTRVDSGLVLGIKGTSDSVRLNGYVHTSIADRPDVVLADGTVLGGEAVDRVLNANGDLSWGGQQGADVLIGGVGNDTLYGAEGNDTLYGSSGNDLLDGGAGSDTFHFARGDGRDTVIDGPALPGERNRLQLGSGISLSDVSFTVENGDLVVGLKGSTDSVRIAGYFGPGPNERTDIVFADGTVLDGLAVDRVVNAYPAGSSLSGTPGADVLVGGVGNDTVVGHFGNDVLYGGAGNDLLDGGVGSDTYHFNRGDGQDTVIDGPGQPGERNRLQLGGGILLSDVSFTLQDGDLVVSLKGSIDSIRLTNYGSLSLADRPQIVFADGTLLDGLAVDRALSASPSGDSFGGTAGDDALVGGAGHDMLYGADGNDALYGGAGNDQLDGGPGRDTYHFNRGDGQDTVQSGWSGPGERDRLQLGAGILLSDLTFTRDGSHLIVGIKGTSNSVRLNGYVYAGPNERPDIVLADGSVLGGEAVDRVLNANGDLSLGGQQGADVLIGGVGNDQLYGAEGNDVLYGGAGNDLLDGGMGSDTFHFGRGDGRDTVIDGPALPGERNRLQLGSGISLSDVSFSVENGDLVVGLKGSTDSVRIAGYFGPGPNERTDIVFADGTVLDGLAVDRVVNAYPAGSSLSGTPGADVLVGGVGNDTVVGHLGNDVLYGGAGNDLLDGGVGSDTYHFNRGDGQDTVIDGPGQPGERNRLQLGAGILLSDVSFTLQDGDLVVSLKGSTDSIRLINYGGPGLQDRTQIVFADGTLLDGLAVDRALSASPSGDSFGGTAGDDALVGGAGHDMLYGAEGNDALYGGAGNDQLDGGPGRDTYHFNRGDGQDTVQSGWSGPGERDRLQLGAGILLSDLTFTRDGSHLIVGIKGTSDSVRLNGYVYTSIADRPDIVLADGSVLGGEAVDRVLNANGDLSLGGQHGADVLIGGVGSDQLYGAEGNDVLYGGAGNDVLDGGTGSDTFHFGRGDGRDTVVDGSALPGERNRLQLGAGISLSVVSFSVENGDLVVGLKGSTDSVRITGYFGPGPNERTDIVFADGTVLGGFAVDQMVNASPGGASVYGTGGADVLVGGVGNDTVVGHLGNDVLYGGAGNDLLDGGVGSDTYHFNRGDGQDTVIDGPGQPGERNRLQLGAGILLSDVSFTLQDGDLVVSLKGSTDSIRLINYGGPGLQDRTQIVFADGTLLDGLAVDRVLQASPSGGSFNGTPGADVLVGGVGHDMLGGGAGDDTLYGGAGNDVLHGDEGRDTYHFNRGDGQDTVDDFATQPGERNRLQLGSGILLSDLTFTREGGTLILGIKGSTDSVRLNGYVYTNPNDRPDIVLADGAVLGGDAVDRVLNASGDLSVGGRLGADVLIGGAGNDTLYGAEGDDTLYGGSGKDVLDGGAGSDTYHFGRGDGQDTAIAKSSRPGEKDRLQLGHDIVQADVSVRAENSDLVLTLSGGADSIRLVDYLLQPKADRTVVAFADGSVWDTGLLERQALNRAPVVGVPLADAAVTEGAPFRYVVPAGAFTDADGDDALTFSIGLVNGSPLPQWLHFDPATGVLEGLPPAGSASALNLVITATDRFGASARDGFDLVVAPNAVKINGTAQADRLTGTAGHDEIRGFSGNDTLVGAAGNDLLDGGVGVDSMTGGTGNDTYVVDHTNDRVVENAGEGNDLVLSNITYTLGSAVESLTLTGTAWVQGTGNALDNVLVGNSGSNSLTGAAGNDTLDGGAGTDSLLGGTGNDVYKLGRGHGIDTIVESDATVGNTDTLQLGADISAAQLWFARNGSNLEVSVIGTGDKAVINGWYAGNRYHVEQFRSGDGKLLLDSQVDGLVNAMAAFAPPAAGQTTLPPNYSASLGAVIASSWK